MDPETALTAGADGAGGGSFTSSTLIVTVCVAVVLPLSAVTTVV